MLHGKQRRQAVPALGGYVYQIWRSLLAWLQLKDDEVLFLEGAEDFEVIAGARATAVQVKNVKKKLTLRDPDAKKAIADFLELRRNNPNHRVSFRFLTTSSVGVEKKGPFGSRKGCLEAWRQCQRTGDQEIARIISEFLLQESALPAEVRLFLEGSSTQDVFVDLIQPLTWETSQAPATIVEDTVTEYLILQGNRVGVPPSEAKKATGNLLQETLTAATRSKASHRRLTKALFLEIFEAVTTERVNRSELTILRRASLSFQSGLKSFPEVPITANAGIHYEPSAELTLLVPENPFPVVGRPKLVAKAKQTLEKYGLVLISASTGMGKTTVAKELTKNCEKPPFWVSLSRMAGAQIPRQLLPALDFVPSGSVWLLDDIDFSTQAPDDGLAVFLYAARERGDWIVLTSQRSIPARLTRLLTLTGNLEVSVPRFDREEVAKFAALLGCPDDRAREWEHVVLLHSRGHPQLIHAHLLGLKTRGWPGPAAEEISRAPETVNREHQETRAQLLARSPQDAIELIYGLSVYNGPFRREHAVAIGEIEELEVRRPGDALDSIIGPWVESIDGSYFRLSPLLEEAGSQVWSEDKVNRICGAIAEAIPRTGGLTLVEAGQLILLSIRGSLDEPLARICTSLLQAPGYARRSVAEHLSWLVFIALNPGTPTLPGRADTRFVFRWLQFRIAAQVAPQTCPAIVIAWDKEARASDSVMPSHLRIVSLAAEVLTAFDAPVPVASVLGYLVELDRVRKESSETDKLWRDMVMSVWGIGDDEDPHYLGLAFLLVANRCSEADDVAALIRALDDLPANLRGQLLSSFSGPPVGRALFIDRAWTAEVKNSMPQWERAIGVLRLAAAASRRWGAATIEATAAAGMAAVFAEYLADFGQAHRCLTDAIGELGPLPILEDQRAMVHFAEEDYKSALAIWDTLLPVWNPVPSSTELVAVGGVGSTLSCRNAAICAARLEQWHHGAEWFLEGAIRAASHLDAWSAPGFQADAGYAYWKAKAYIDSIEYFGRALRDLDRLGEQDTNVRARVVGKLVGHALLWITTVTRGGATNELGEPYAGMCSNPKTPEGVAELPQTPLDFSWLHLCNIEEVLLQRSAVFDEGWQRLSNSPYRSVRVFIFELAIHKAFRLVDFECLPSLAARYSTEALALKAAMDMGEDPLTLAPLRPNDPTGKDLALAYDLLVAAMLVSGVEVAGDFRDLFDQWRKSASSTHGVAEFESWLEKAEHIFAGPVTSAKELMIRPPDDRDLRLLAIARVALEDVVMPGDRFYAHSLLFSVFLDGLWWRELVPYLGTLIERGWLRALESPATLRSPAITVPAIRDACATQLGGMRKAAEVLLAAEAAVDVNLPPSLRDRLRLLSRDAR